MDTSFEGGVRPTQFWRWAVDREVRARAARRQGRLGQSGSAPSLAAPDFPGSQEPIHDHGLIFTSLHDLHRQQARAALRLPPVHPASPAKDPSPWGWQRGNHVPSDVESAVTLATTAAMTSLFDSGARLPARSCIGPVPEGAEECRRRARGKPGMSLVT
uniref:Uncharacterized protein n=1 Tax=Alexandrium catenella TaxID=2925 RepID=A0A7S1L660_ALECA